MNDLVICVFGCVTIEKYKQELLKIVETWGKHAKERNVKVLYFLGEEQMDMTGKDHGSNLGVSDAIGENFIYMKGVTNDKLSASYKQNLGLKYIYEKYNPAF